MAEISSAEVNENVAGAQGTVVIDGKTYLIDQVTDQAMATLHRHLRKTMKSPLAAIMDSLRGLPEELQKIAVAEAVKLQANGGAEGNSAFYHDQMLSPNGCGFLFWILAKRNHPELTLEKCVELVAKSTPEMVMTELATASGLTSLASEGN